MSHGFLGYNATFMLDAVVCALVVLVPLLAWSIYLVKWRRQYAIHRQMQLVLAGVLFMAVMAFEYDVQHVHHGWQNIVRGARPKISASDLEFIHGLLRVHLVFAISTPLVWVATIVLALRRFPSPPAPSPHSRLHAWMGWVSASDLALTSATGVLFYYFAFVQR